MCTHLTLPFCDVRAVFDLSATSSGGDVSSAADESDSSSDQSSVSNFPTNGHQPMLSIHNARVSLQEMPKLR